MVENINVISLLNNNYSLSRKERYKRLSKKFNKEKNIDFQKLLDSINNENINQFVKVMIENNKEKYLNHFFFNLSNVKILKDKKKQNKYLSKRDFGGNYFTKNNIYLILGDKKELEENNALLTPYHELLHLISMKIDNSSIIRLGFQFNDFATGLNEGYTELLTKRYFGNISPNDYNAYPHFIWYSNMLEELLGKDKMEDYYFSFNIEGLIIEISKYIGIEKTFKLFIYSDLLFEREDEMYNNENLFLDYDNLININKVNCYYDDNLNLRNKIYNIFLEINEKLNKSQEFKEEFKDKNNKKNIQIEYEEELYRECFKEEKRGDLNGTKNYTRKKEK